LLFHSFRGGFSKILATSLHSTTTLLEGQSLTGLNVLESENFCPQIITGACPLVLCTVSFSMEIVCVFKNKTKQNFCPLPPMLMQTPSQ